MSTHEPISLERLKELLHYDSATGVFTWRVTRAGSKGVCAGKVAGGPTKKRAWLIGVERTRYKAHRLAWFYHYGEWPEVTVDHIDGNPMNNRIANLRDVEHHQNLQNIRKAHKDSGSGLLGAFRNKRGRPKKWRSAIRIQDKLISLGAFYSAQEAHEAYLKAKKMYHPFQTLT